jgi:hypothetical protein
MRGGWMLLVGGLAWTQIEAPDSLARLFERDMNFDIVVGRTFPVVTVLTDTFPLSPLLSGSARVGLSWRWGVGGERAKKWLLVLSPLLLLEKVTFRATGASVVPGVELVQQEKYFWFKYRSGALMLAGGIRFQRWEPQALFPRWWVEMGCWGAYRFGRSMKYVAEREGRMERVRIEGNPHLAPAQGGGYIRIGRQWAFVEAYYHLLSYFRAGTYGEAPARSYPAMPKWEVGIGVAL